VFNAARTGLSKRRWVSCSLYWSLSWLLFMTDDFLKKQERFFALAGYAITRWAYIDRSLFDFCKFALSTTEHKTAIVFYRTPSIGDHLGLANALFGASDLPPEALERWKRIAREMQRLLSFRNDLAHNPPVQLAYITMVGDQVTDQRQEWQFRTDPTKLLHQPPKQKTRKIEATANDVSAHIAKVELLEQAIAALHWQLMGRPPGLGPTIPPPDFPGEMDQW
jgi:hypothetical protein